MKAGQLDSYKVMEETAKERLEELKKQSRELIRKQSRTQKSEVKLINKMIEVNCAILGENPQNHIVFF